MCWCFQSKNCNIATNFTWLNALTRAFLPSIDFDRLWRFTAWHNILPGIYTSSIGSATGCNGFLHTGIRHRKYLIIFGDVWVCTHFGRARALAGGDVIPMKSYRINLTATQIMRKIPHWWFCVYFENFHRKCIPNCTWFCTCGKCTDEVGKYRKFSMWFVNVSVPKRTRFQTNFPYTISKIP